MNTTASLVLPLWALLLISFRKRQDWGNEHLTALAAQTQNEEFAQDKRAAMERLIRVVLVLDGSRFWAWRNGLLWGRAKRRAERLLASETRAALGYLTLPVERTVTRMLGLTGWPIPLQVQAVLAGLSEAEIAAFVDAGTCPCAESLEMMIALNT